MQPNYAEVIALAKLAGEAILQIYNRSDFTAVTEKEDASPLTEADLAAHQILNDGLQEICNIPVVSEESPLPPKEERSRWNRFWLIDPLDGTKEFIDRNDEFTINIALIEEGEPVFGLIYIPVSDECYYGGEGKAFKKTGAEPAIPIKTSSPSAILREFGYIRVLASRRHATEQLDRLCDRLSDKLGGVKKIAAGSAIKLAYLSEGRGELYPRFGNVSEWDIAAGHAILRCIGGDVVTRQFEPIRYGHKPTMIVPGFFAVGDVDYDWRPILLT